MFPKGRLLGRRHPVQLGRSALPVAVKSATARALPRYFGLGRGLTFYTWTSDQHSQYGSRVISATVRDATHVLDAILDNQTELEIAEHTTTRPATATWSSPCSICSGSSSPPASAISQTRASTASGRSARSYSAQAR